MERDERRQDFDDRRGSLWLSLESGWSVQEFSDFLQSLRYAHASITLVFQGLETRWYSSRGRLQYSEWENRVLFPTHSSLSRNSEVDIAYGRSGYNRPYNELYSQYYEYHRAATLNRLWPGDDILLGEVTLRSPGLAEIIGALNPLTVIKDLIIIIRDWKTDKRHRVLENELLETEIMKNMIEMMKEAHFTDAQIKEFIDNHIVMPLNEVRPYQDRGLVVDAKIKALDDLET